MVIKNFLRFLGVTCVILLSVTVSAHALTGDQNTFPGASNAADYQPPTGNPQNDVGSVSQGQTNQNDLQKPEAVNQTTLPTVPDLRVVGVEGETNANTTKTEVAENDSSSRVWLAVAIGAAAVGVVVLALSNSKRQVQKAGHTSGDKSPIKATVEKETTTVEPAQKPKEATTKKAAKRKKGKSRKTKRKR